MTLMSTSSNDSNPLGVGALGDFIRSQRRLAELSQRELAKLADLSDAYLSQLERGLHEPSVRVVNGLSSALNVPAEKLLNFLGRERAEGADVVTTESAIATDESLTDAQKQSLLDVYRAFIAANEHT
ncbi:MAG: helix-turn-helix transcriptional regulator [Ilumatobacter sp.]|jgi:transcriptional regulator with XRE-family HTH domain|nr:helix-turn-helix transcriptional regulator [Ilumatobacter sp.]MBT5276827.1 helix-turn-helix transcriptional regulator [Ilumatobacter sp.]MBT5552310.1 helix-turn-helix transcriptional regulator [Ilumatobacter sp.]MBT5866409.1 helix-turn-helix transcriptional regulator [Ilumatobacter sp.]MBT7428362.1 helix-turn-helix transcriptional regulator [Ilumatobacter sp.]